MAPRASRAVGRCLPCPDCPAFQSFSGCPSPSCLPNMTPSFLPVLQASPMYRSLSTRQSSPLGAATITVPDISTAFSPSKAPQWPSRARHSALFLPRGRAVASRFSGRRTHPQGPPMHACIHHPCHFPRGPPTWNPGHHLLLTGHAWTCPALPCLSFHSQPALISLLLTDLSSTTPLLLQSHLAATSHLSLLTTFVYSPGHRKIRRGSCRRITNRPRSPAFRRRHFAGSAKDIVLRALRPLRRPRSRHRPAPPPTQPKHRRWSRLAPFCEQRGFADEPSDRQLAREGRLCGDCALCFRIKGPRPEPDTERHGQLLSQ